VTTVRARELRTLTREELEQRLREAREELFNLKFQHKTGQLGNPLRIREVRKDIARLTTVLKEGQVAGAPATEATPGDAQPATGE
jgi:large subunit ribosomal protein L29